MLINNIDISSLGVRLYDRIISSNKINTVEDWLDGDIQPTFIRQQDTFKNIELKFLVLSNNEEEAFIRISKLTQLLKHATLKFDDLNLVFNVNIQGVARQERLKNGNFIVSYTLTSDYAKGDREVYTTNANMTNSFKLTVLYYQNTTTLLATENITIRASAFNGLNDTLTSIGIPVDKYLPQYYNNGVATNLAGIEISYENLQTLNTLIINYTPISYNLTVEYFTNSGSGYYNKVLTKPLSFTKPQITGMTSIGQLVDAVSYKPVGYRGRINYDGPITVEALLLASPISVYYDAIQNEQSKNITVRYETEDDDGSFILDNTAILNVSESDFIEGMTLGNFLNLNLYKPTTYFNNGYVVDADINDLITYETIETSYVIRYARTTNIIYVEYYVGSYPGWSRLTTTTISTKYKDRYETEFDLLDDLNIDLDKYHTSPYNNGSLYNSSSFTTYEDVLNAGVLQVYYTPISFPIVVNYYVGDTSATPEVETININALMFLNDPILSDIIPIATNRPEGYQFNADLSYSGEVSLSALTLASPISIVYEEITVSRTKNIIVRYKKELTSTYSVINTSLITVNEADCVGGVRLYDIINLNLYKPQYYENGIIDGASSSALMAFDNLGSSYDVLYLASSYNLPVRYYTDDVDEANWIGSANISYRVIDFETTTTLYTLGLNVNLFKPAYADNGVLQYNGPVNFSALQGLTSVNIVYETIVEPEDPEGINYPHRFLFLQHNDLGDYEHLHPEWTMNHAYINAGVAVDDMSKLTVIMECERVDDNVPLHTVNEGYAYLFGSTSTLGSFYMRFNNQTLYGTNLSGVNTYEARAGRTSDLLVVNETNAIGFGPTSGIYETALDGYSNAIFTYTSRLATDGASMPYPLYLFANNNSGSYADGLAGIGIYSCKIYYDNNLLRDFIPVAFYDKIGDQVAPSNCLYDKVSKSFFEDATGLNSFNIRDDDRYEDTDPSHQLGHCYVNYYKGEQLFQTLMINFRGDDFIGDNVWDPYEKFRVDYYQPAYYNSGTIQNMPSGFVVNFNNLNNQTFNVVYLEQANTITVKYIKEDENEERTTLAEETIGISESDFYQVPTFGQIVRLNKYKPEGYETNFEYTGARVSLARVIEGSPYEIVYTPIEGEPQTYTTIIQYMKKVYGIRNYEVLGNITLTLDESNFRDGEFIDYYINFNLKKPEIAYDNGEPYEWYRMDEMIDTPEKLRDIYRVYYLPTEQTIDINYYVDSVSDANLIASTSWPFAIDTYDYPISIVDTLPNSYLNKYKPVNCAGGVFEDPTATYDFDDLIEAESINIIYERLTAPDDPTTQSWENKVLYWGVDDYSAINTFSELSNVAGKIPYIDLGYKPKELGRLRVEAKLYACGCGYSNAELAPNQGHIGANYSVVNLDYLPIFGYYGTKYYNKGADADSGLADSVITTPLHEDITETEYSDYSVGSKGAFAIMPRLPVASSWAYTAEGPQSLDGKLYYAGGSGTGIIAGSGLPQYTGISACYRKGVNKTLNDELEITDAYNDYGIRVRRDIPTTGGRGWSVCEGRTGQMGEEVNNPTKALFGNPYTIILDAYNDYAECYNEDDTNSPYQVKFDNTDEDFFEGRQQPKGSLSLFVATDPETGKVNINPFSTSKVFPAVSPSGTPMRLQRSALGDPYSANSEYGSYTTQELVGTGTDASGNIIYQTIDKTYNINYIKFGMPEYPQPIGCWLWGLKIYDRDVLVRDLIPVAEGDQIYGYTMPANGLFDKITEIFFGNNNKGGDYTLITSGTTENGEIRQSVSNITITPNEILPLQVMYDPLTFGKITANYYDDDNTFINNQFINVPVWYNGDNEPIENILGFNDFKPDDFHLDGMIDLDADLSFEGMTTKDIYDLGSANIYYKLKTYTKTIVYYQDNYRVGSKDLFFSLDDIKNASTLEDLGVDVDLFWNDQFAHGRVSFNEEIIDDDDIKAFIDAPSPVVIYDKLTVSENPNLLYAEYYRGGAYEE